MLAAYRKWPIYLNLHLPGVTSPCNVNTLSSKRGMRIDKVIFIQHQILLFNLQRNVLRELFIRSWKLNAYTYIIRL